MSGLRAFLTLALPVMVLFGMALMPLQANAQVCEPCVTLDASEVETSICAGDSARVLLRATNCGNLTGDIRVTGPGGLDHLCKDIAPNDFCEFVHAFKTEPECPAEGEFVFQFDAEFISTACKETATDDGFAKFACCTPRIEVEKTCPDTATLGEPFLHVVTVRVPEGSCDLEVTAYDTICISGLPDNLASAVSFRPEPSHVIENGVGGGDLCFPFTFPAGTLSAGQESTFTVLVTINPPCDGDITINDRVEVKGICGSAEVTDEDECLTTIHCKIPDCDPCVTLDASEANPQICAGDDAIVLLRATNCSTEKARIVITGPDGFEFICEDVEPNATCETADTISTSETCPDNGEFVFQYLAVLSIDNCPETADDDGFAKFFCCTPAIEVSKRCPEEVADGETFTYGILVSVPEGACDLESITVTDELCDGVVYADNASIPPSEAPTEGESGTVVWELGPLAAGDEVTITFEVTAKSDCEEDDCENHVTVEGECGEAKVSDADSCDTKIICEEGTGCPRTVGFWGQQTQCDEGEGGNVKFSCEELALIADCADDLAVIFNWADDLAGFDAIINPDPPMSKREQAKRQFLGFLANHCAGILPVTANNGDLINLALDLPITDCTYATTVGELLAYADAQLVALEGGSEDNDAYTGFKDCLDDVNNHLTIAYDSSACHVPRDVVPTVGTEDLGRTGSTGQTATGIDPAAANAELLRPVPNPFSRTTTMAYAVGATSGERVEIAIYNTSGQRIKSLVSETKGAGRYSVTWDGRNDSGVEVPAGVYFYRVAIGAESNVSRVVLVK